MKLVLMAPLDTEAHVHNWGAPALGIMRIHSYLQHQVNRGKLPPLDMTIYDNQIDHYDPIVHWSDQHVDILGISLLHYTLHKTLEIIHKWRAIHPETLIVVGGNEAGANYQQIMDNAPVDIAVTAEGEEVMAKIIKWRMGDLGLDAIHGIIYRSFAKPINNFKLWNYWQTVDFSLYRYEDYWREMEIMYEKLDKETAQKIRTVRLLMTSHCMRNCAFCSLAKVRNIACGQRVTPAYLSGKQMMNIIDSINRQLPKTETIYFCFTCDNKVLTNNGLVKISEINLEQKVISHDGNIHPVKKLMKREYNGDIIKIRPYYSPEFIISTPEHRFFTKDGIKEARQLTPNDYLIQKFDNEIISENKLYLKRIYDSIHTSIGGKYHYNNGWDTNIPESINLTTEILELFGLYIAEGSTSRAQVQFSITPYRDDLMEFVNRMFSKYFNKYVHSDKKQDAIHMYINSTCLVRIFRYLFGYKAIVKQIPDEFMKLNPTLQRYLVKGIFLGDGSIKQVNRWNHIWKNLRISSSSSKLIYQIRMLLLRNNIIPSIFKEKIRNTSINGKKIISNADPYSIVWNSQTIEDFIKGKSVVNTRGYIKDDIAYYKIRKIERDYFDGLVYNLMVKDTHSYNINGFLVKNCTDDVFYPNPQPFLDFCELYKRSGYNYRILIQTSSYSMKDEYFPILRNIGCKHITVGVENASEAMRKAFNKPQNAAKLDRMLELGKQYGITMYYLIILIPPASTFDDLWINYRTISKWLDMGAEISIEPIVYSYKGTPLYDDVRFSSSYVMREITGTNKKYRDAVYVMPSDPGVYELTQEFIARRDQYVDDYFKKLPTNHQFKGLTSRPILMLLKELLDKYDPREE